MTTTKRAPSKKAAEKAEALAALAKIVRDGDTLYTVLRHRSASGMQRALDVYAIKGNEPLCLTWTAAVATGARYDRKREVLIVRGCGFDVGDHVVDHVAQLLKITLRNRWLG